MAEVLIVDDDVDAREPLGKYLAKIGHAVRFAPGGEEALAEVVLKPPDVVLLDLHMPEVSGADFLSLIRSNWQFHLLPVVVLTGVSDARLLREVRRFNVDSVLVKSRATFEDIRRTIEEITHGGRPTRESAG